MWSFVQKNGDVKRRNLGFKLNALICLLPASSDIKDKKDQESVKIKE